MTRDRRLATRQLRYDTSVARVAIIGTGWGARVQVPIFREAGLNVVAIAGHDPEKTRKTAETLGIARAVDDWQKIIKRGEADLISIVTPPSEHREMAVAALEAGMHVLSEKPTAMNADEADSMVRAAEARPSQMALIDHELRFLPAWMEARTRREEIGAIRFAEFRFTSPGRGDPSRPWNWWSDASRGGGVLGAVGSHAIDAFRYLAGEIREVKATLNTVITERPNGDDWRPVTSDDYAALHVRFEHGAVGTILLSVTAAVDEPTTITIHGEQGGMRLRGEGLELASLGGDWNTIVPDVETKRPGNSNGGAFGTGTLHLARALRKAIDEHDREALLPAATFRDGLQQQRALDAARRSHAGDGGWIAIPH
jgi:predicted dehydrogenase